MRSASGQPDIPSDTTYVKLAGIPPTYVSDNNNNSDDEIRFRYSRRRDDDREQSPIPPEDIAQSLLETINLQNWVLEQDQIEQRVLEASNRRHSNEHPTESTPSDIVVATSLKPDPLTRTKKVHRSRLVQTSAVVVDAIKLEFIRAPTNVAS